jgi:hypothetical protein
MFSVVRHLKKQSFKTIQSDYSHRSAHPTPTKSVIQTGNVNIQKLLCRDRSIGIMKGDRLDDRGSIPGRGKRFFSAPQRSNLLLVAPSLLSDGYGWHFLGA